MNLVCPDKKPDILNRGGRIVIMVVFPVSGLAHLHHRISDLDLVEAEIVSVSLSVAVLIEPKYHQARLSNEEGLLDMELKTILLEQVPIILLLIVVVEVEV